MEILHNPNIIFLFLFLGLVVYTIFFKTTKEPLDITHYEDNGAEKSLLQGYKMVNRVALLLEDNNIIYRIPKTFTDPITHEIQTTGKKDDINPDLYRVDCFKYLPRNMLKNEFYPDPKYRVYHDCYRRKASRYLVPSLN